MLSVIQHDIPPLLLSGNLTKSLVLKNAELGVHAQALEDVVKRLRFELELERNESLELQNKNSLVEQEMVKAFADKDDLVGRLSETTSFFFSTGRIDTMSEPVEARFSWDPVGEA